MHYPAELIEILPGLPPVYFDGPRQEIRRAMMDGKIPETALYATIRASDGTELRFRRCTCRCDCADVDLRWTDWIADEFGDPHTLACPACKRTMVQVAMDTWRVETCSP